MSLEELIIQRIRREGPLSFRDFMEMALYYPDAGYYSANRDQIGEKGDFYTSPWFTSLFGKLIARQLEEMWYLLNEKTFTIVEYGAGTGVLCRDILQELKSNRKLYSRLHYCIIEKSATMREKEKEILPAYISWYDSIRDIPPVTGCILSNEVVDNFSVHQVVMKQELMEVFVDYDNGFVELLRPASPVLKDYLAQLNVILPEGFRTEINLEAIRWIHEMAAVLRKGFIVTIDYGYPSSELYSSRRSAGTLLCYHKHRINDHPYRHIGEQDITSHVNFSALQHWGIKNGLECDGFTSQAYFLLGLGLAAHARQINANGPTAQFLHTFLTNMGQRLKVLVQHKGIKSPRLSGLQFSQQFV